MNIERMRRANRRRVPEMCRSRYSHAPGHPVEICTLPVGHREMHNWPSWGQTVDSTKSKGSPTIFALRR